MKPSIHNESGSAGLSHSEIIPFFIRPCDLALGYSIGRMKGCGQGRLSKWITDIFTNGDFKGQTGRTNPNKLSSVSPHITLSRPPDDPSSSAFPHRLPVIPHFFTHHRDSSPSSHLYCDRGPRFVILVPLALSQALHTSVWPPRPAPERRLATPPPST